MADALASGASVRKDVGVQVPPRAPLVFSDRTAIEVFNPEHDDFQIDEWFPLESFNTRLSVVDLELLEFDLLQVQLPDNPSPQLRSTN
jgi:hypothetical protein